MRELIEIDGRQFISCPAVARRLGVSQPAVRKWSRAGILPTMRQIGLRTFFFDRSDLGKAMREFKEKPHE